MLEIIDGVDEDRALKTLRDKKMSERHKLEVVITDWKT